jgi:hypothetical protein
MQRPGHQGVSPPKRAWAALALDWFRRPYRCGSLILARVGVKPQPGLSSGAGDLHPITGSERFSSGHGAKRSLASGWEKTMAWRRLRQLKNRPPRLVMWASGGLGVNR